MANGLAEALTELTARFERASQAYADQSGIVRDDDWFVLKLAEETGELTQAWVRSTGRGRTGGLSEDERRTALADETADLLGHILLFAGRQSLDLPTAVERKWRFSLREAEATASTLPSV